ncbi:RecF/RecN/SMC [Lipomyces oligophaga]|uniref:RecF/RecN/SMC n=1 Tax=Lipomyces oligophaga TaxID=45792 RepID=UPI0034CE9177
MRLEELIIDGFKSYATRTVISGWDPQFNCITGLNGSGKSNILDAICFVLGITTMSTVRAQNLQDLIYKRGQAGVTKASVTIVFDNRDAESSPIGFETCPQISVTRQIVLGGTSKYLINGHRAQQQTVQNLFQSIQLNINSPNFLIMQGRITKVLNMKPTEILAMIEEASGTRMFEERRDKAIKTITKKDKKVEEINGLLREEIEPKLEKLRTEKRSFLELQQTQSDLERLTKVVVAHDYVKYTNLLNNFGQLLDNKTSELNTIEFNLNRTRREMTVINEEIRRIQALRETELQKGTTFQKLEQQMKEFSHNLVRLNTHLELKSKNILEEEQNGNQLKKMISNLSAQLETKAQELTIKEAEYKTLTQAHEVMSSEALIKEELLEALRIGVASKEGQTNGYMDQLEEAKTAISQAKTKQEQVKLQILHLQKRVKELEPKAKKARQQNQGLFQKLESLKADCLPLEAALKEINFDPHALDKMRHQEAESEAKVRHLGNKIADLKRKVANVDFSYTDPVPGFDRSKVKGLVAQLFSIEPSKFEAASALEICAGGRLYNVVVDNEVTGSQLLENGKLRRRVTIIPLNKIAGFKASAEQIGAAKSIAPGKVNIALSLVGYDEELYSAMNYVFGSTFICADADTAKKVTFDDRVRMKSVTLQGDMYDPNGTLSGGSAPNENGGILIVMQELNKLNAEYDQELSKLNQLKEIKAAEKGRIDKGTQITQKLDLKKHELSLLEQQIANNSSSAVINDLNSVCESIEAFKNEIIVAQEQQKKSESQAKKIEKDMKEFETNKDSKLENLKREAENRRNQATKQLEQVKSCQRQLQIVELDRDQIQADLNNQKEAYIETEKNWHCLKKEIERIQQEQVEIQVQYEEISKTVETEKAKMMGFDEELDALDQTLKAKEQSCSDFEIGQQKMKHELEKIVSEKQVARGKLDGLVAEYPWIEEDKESFGRSGSVYDYSGVNISDCIASMKKLGDRYSEMKKTVNGKVMNMIDSVEKKEIALRSMLKTVEKDKRKIEETIVSLDKYKKEALINTWRKVDSEFGKIFADMLPGNFAKLVPVEGKEVTEGIEIRVCLGKVWKESLVELSGGQRSLVALSLIMALLQFKPAPMYILDEVDAALDLSHTQNIGRLIKTRFNGSQFIVVSLKDGLFSNANKVFRARFQEGTSVVTAM